MKSQAIVLSAALLALGVGGAMAQTDGDARMSKLEEKVRLLEQRVAALEGQSRGGAATSSVAPDKVNWRKLRNGMSEADVEQLLGSPSKVESNIVFTTWYYGHYPTGGQVQFDTTSQTVEGWHEP